MAEWGSEIKPHSTAEISVQWEILDQPRLVHAYVVPWTIGEEGFGGKHATPAFPEPIRRVVHAEV
jgi:hypothetical protein